MTAPNRTMVLAIILACYLMIIVDISVIITALPDIHSALERNPPRCGRARPETHR